MNKKRDFTADFKDIKEMTDKIRGRINESINFSDDYQDDASVPHEEPEIPTEVDGEQEIGKMNISAGKGKTPEEQELENEANDPSSAVNQIREIALKGMVALCHTPEDPQYEVLKQIFTYCDKANKKKSEEEKV